MSEHQAKAPTMRALLPSRLVPEDMLSEWQGPNLPNTTNYAPPPDSMRGRMGDVLMQSIAALGGFTGLPMSGEGDRAALMGELLAAGMPLVGGVKGTLKNLVSRTLTNGFYSRLDEAASMIPKKGVPATGVLNWLKKAPEGISTEEVAYRKLPEWLASQGTKTVTPEMLAAHLKENPAPFPKVKTLGGPQEQITKLPEGYQVQPLAPADAPQWPSWYRQSTRFGIPRNYTLVSPDGTGHAFYALNASEANDIAVSMLRLQTPPLPQPKFSQYQVPGGENYRETLLTLPPFTLDNAPPDLMERAKQLANASTEGWEKTSLEGRKWYLEKAAGGQAPFHSSHYPDDPNLLVHTRANERTLPTGEPGRFIEEVQSDAHQLALKKGYRSAANDEKPYVVKFGGGADGQEIGRFASEQAAQDFAVSHRRANGNENWKYFVAHEQGADAVPDLPFKENWPDLGLKQQLIEAANDPKAEWLGFTGGKTQADRYDLSKQISEVNYYDGHLNAKDLDGNQVFDRDVAPDALADVIGKDAAEKLLGQPKQGLSGVQSLRGLDLQVGGEGMTAFYDQKLPKRLEKIVKPFGGTVEPVALTPNRMAKVGSGPVVDEPNASWLSRLTPEMKAAIQRGVPLMSIVAAALSAGLISTADAQQIKQQGYR